MFKYLTKKYVEGFEKRVTPRTKTDIFIAQASIYLTLSFILGALSIFISVIEAKESMEVAQVGATITLLLACITLFVRSLDIVFEAVKYDFDNKKNIENEEVLVITAENVKIDLNQNEKKV